MQGEEAEAQAGLPVEVVDQHQARGGRAAARTLPTAQILVEDLSRRCAAEPLARAGHDALVRQREQAPLRVVARPAGRTSSIPKNNNFPMKRGSRRGVVMIESPVNICF